MKKTAFLVTILFFAVNNTFAAVFYFQNVFDHNRNTPFPFQAGQSFVVDNFVNLNAVTWKIGLPTGVTCPETHPALVMNTLLFETNDLNNPTSSILVNQTFAQDPTTPQAFFIDPLPFTSGAISKGVTTSTTQNFPTTTLDPSKIYRIEVSLQCWTTDQPIGSNITAGGLLLGYTNTNPVVGVAIERTSSGFNIFDENADFFLILDSTTQVEAPIITNPPNNAIITALPFEVSGTCNFNGGIRSVLLRFEDNVGTATGGSVTCNTDNTFSTTSDQFPIGFWNGDWHIFAKGLDASGVSITGESKNDFTINVFQNPNIQPPTITSDQGTTCEGDTLTEKAICFLARQIRNILTFLFVPSDSVLNRFATLKTQVENKPPFGYFTVAKNALTTMNTASSGETLQGVSALANFFNPIRNIVIASLWILFVVWLIHRIQRVEI
jgi:hypothetical protein